MHLREYCDDKYKLLKGTESFIKSQIQTMANSDSYFSVSSHIGMNQKQSNKWFQQFFPSFHSFQKSSL